MPITIPPQFFAQQNRISEQKFSETKKFFETLQFGADTPYKHGVVSSQASVPNSSFHAIRSTVTAKGDLLKFIQKDLNAPQVIPGQPKYGLLEKTYYYENDEMKNKMVTVTSVDQKLSCLVYSIMEGPMMVADREFLTFKTVHKASDGKVYITLYTVGDDIKGKPKAVRSVSQKLMIFEQIGEDVKIVQFSYADPKGNIPAGIYNKQLDGQNAMLAAVVRTDK